jgi:hypothetical protein
MARHLSAYLGERSNLRLSIIRRDVIDSNTLAARETQVDHLWDSLKSAVLCLVVKVGSPVVAATVR